VGPDHQSAPETFRLLSADHHDGGLPNLATPEGQRAIEPLFEGASLVVLDNLSTLTSVERDNDAESWTSMQAWLLCLRRRGMSVLFVHHSGKNGQQRGTSRREDVLDTVIALKKPKDYRASDGARFEIHYEKARGLVGIDASPFEARLEMSPGTARWSVADLVDPDAEKVADLVKQGRSLRHIEKETGISRSKAGRLKRKIDKDIQAATEDAA
jgi:putative DNA primase/helicase